MFALIIDNKIIVGPRDWYFPFFNEGLTQNGIEYELPRGAPSEPIITEEFQILPARLNPIAKYNPFFEQLAGPNWAIGDNELLGTYGIAPTSVAFAQNTMKNEVTRKRYMQEIGGTTFTFADGETVGLYTDRENRRAYVDNLASITDGETIVFKFKDAVFKTINKDDLNNIVKTVNAWLDTCFQWEATKYSEIDGCTTIEELKNISIKFPGETEV